MQKNAIILVGLTYSGKTVVGRELARRLAWPFVDTDDLVVPLAGGKPIPEVFSEWGEARFRGLESQALGMACGRGRVVIATGGGAALDAGNRALMSGAGVVYWLNARPETLYQRYLQAEREQPDRVSRPLVDGVDARERLRGLWEQRLGAYAASADWIILTDTLSSEDVVEEVLRTFGRLRGQLGEPSQGVPPLEDVDEQAPPGPHTAGLPANTTGAVAVVSSSGGSYPIFVGNKVLNTLPGRLRDLTDASTAYIVSDAHVYEHYGQRTEGLLREAGLSVDSYVLPPGEPSKSIDHALGLYDWLMERRAERRHVIVALGGGVVGDLAGFVAATYLRGMPYVQVPTTLLAMADASIGGKTGVNRAAAKNLVGSFYQPRFVLEDVDLLRTLGTRERTEGWAEIIKHAFIRDPQLLEVLEKQQARLTALELNITARVLAASAAIKADVVSQDERESGLRAILNYGHTIGHGLETALAYEGLLHGEAVSIGIAGAARISHRMGLLPQEAVERQEQVLTAYGLPIRIPGINLEAVQAAMKLDKKVQNSRQRWILLRDFGQTEIRDDVPTAMVTEVLEELAAP